MTERMDIPVQCAVDARCALGESPVWDAGQSALYWADIVSCLVHRWEPISGERREWRLPAAVGSIGLRACGGLVLALRTGFHTLDLDANELTFLAHPEADQPSNRFNDGKVSPEGRFWAGTMDDREDKQRVGALYRLNGDHRCDKVVDGLRVSNGLAWSPDGRTMYHSDSRGGAIFRHAYDPASGEVGPRDLFVAMQPDWGRPDGAAVDEEGNYWSCGVGAGRINRFNPNGELTAWVPMPITHPTMPCFGGPRGRTLYVTSLRHELSVNQLAVTPQAGGVFVLDVGVAGAPVGTYIG